MLVVTQQQISLTSYVFLQVLRKFYQDLLANTAYRENHSMQIEMK